MRIVFMGTPEFAVPTMLEIVKNGHVLVAVYTRAPARGGRRGLEVRKTPVHEVADLLGIPVLTPTSLRDEASHNVFRILAADVAVVAAYGLLLPTPILEAPRLGCVKLHASLLPRWRGAAPIQRAIMAGDAEQASTSCAWMPVSTPVRSRCGDSSDRPEYTAGDLTSRLAVVAAKLSVTALRSMEFGRLEFREQSTVGVCYARKIEKSEAEVDWTQDAPGVRNQIMGRRQRLAHTPKS